MSFVIDTDPLITENEYSLNDFLMLNHAAFDGTLEEIWAASIYSLKMNWILATSSDSMLSPYGKILKDIGRTFKPYQYPGKAGKDLLQPVRGLETCFSVW